MAHKLLIDHHLYEQSQDRQKRQLNESFSKQRGKIDRNLKLKEAIDRLNRHTCQQQDRQQGGMNQHQAHKLRDQSDGVRHGQCIVDLIDSHIPLPPDEFSCIKNDDDDKK